MMTSETQIHDRARYDLALRGFLWRQAANCVELFGSLVAPSLKPIVELDDRATSPELLACPAWAEFGDLFEYAVNGVEPDGGPPLKRDFYDIFAGPGGLADLDPHLQEVYLLATARNVLDGGQREHSPLEDVPTGYLSVLEVAALARMEPRSVRNAMHPKQSDRLIGESFGARTFISVPDARRWLANRRGFVPTTRERREGSDRTTALLLPESLVTRLVLAAAKEGVSIPELVSRKMLQAATEGPDESNAATLPQKPTE